MTGAVSRTSVGPIDVNGADTSRTSQRGVGKPGAARPITRRAIITSPVALSAPTAVAEIIPGRARGRVTFFKVCQRLAPSDREASLSSKGTFRRASSIKGAINGITSRASTNPPKKMLFGVPGAQGSIPGFMGGKPGIGQSPGWMPSAARSPTLLNPLQNLGIMNNLVKIPAVRAYTMGGIPASIPSRPRSPLPSRPEGNSEANTAIASDAGRAIATAITAARKVVHNAGSKP